MRIGVVGRLEPDMLGANVLDGTRAAGHVAVPLGLARAQRITTILGKIT